MRLKFIPPFLNMETPPGVEPANVTGLRRMEAEGLLDGIDWDIDEGFPGPVVEDRESLAVAVPGVLKLVRAACESGRYDAVILLGGLEPGLYAAMEIGAPFGIPVVGCTHSQAAYASVLGNKFTLMDTLESMAIPIRQNLMSYGMNEKCVSVRSIEWPVMEILANPSGAADAFVQETIEAIEQDGADLIVCGCTALVVAQPLAQERLIEAGYDIPVLHSYRCAIEMAKSLVKMKVSQSKYAFPSKEPKKRMVPR
ncbi:MAG: aspartate/glutamate racemase family protein [Nitrospinota bacterium]|nr:aspartate/glutamate racemase family protein [Nitrospinota bacterium]